jgi:hypothetical protein
MSGKYGRAHVGQRTFAVVFMVQFQAEATIERRRRRRINREQD